MSLVVRSLEVLRSRTVLTIWSRFTCEARRRLETKEVSIEILLFSFVSVSFSRLLLRIRFISRYFCLSLLFSYSWLCSTYLSFSTKACLYCSITTLSSSISSTYFYTSFEIFFTSFYFSLLASLMDSSALMVFEWQVNYISLSLLYN